MEDLMSEGSVEHDSWARWVLERQFENDPEKQKAGLAGIEAVRTFRDRVLRNATIADGDVVLDVGCGSGLIGFGALQLVGEHGTIIFSDISQELLDHCRDLAHEIGALDLCRFVRAAADDLSAIPDSSVDVVTTRSVLIYVRDKEHSFQEFWRVLRPKGRLSIFEPINRFGSPETEHVYWGGYDVSPVWDIARKLRALYQGLQPPDSDPMLDFDERDLLAYAENAGFGEIHLEFKAEIKPSEPRRWEEYIQIAGNPKIPTLAEAMSQVLTSDEVERYAAHMRPLVERGAGRWRMAYAYLRAIKDEPKSMS